MSGPATGWKFLASVQSNWCASIVWTRILDDSQATVFAATTTANQDAKLRSRASWLYAGGMFMVITQCVTACGIWGGMIYASCKTNDQCGVGRFCGVNARLPYGANCWYCGNYAPIWKQVDPATGYVLNEPGADNWAGDHGLPGFNQTLALEYCNGDPAAFADCDYIDELDVRIEGGDEDDPFRPRSSMPAGVFWYCRDQHTGVIGGSLKDRSKVDPAVAMEKAQWKDLRINWCERCVHPTSGHVDELTGWLLPAFNVDTMGFADYLAYIFTSLFVALTLVGEMKDVSQKGTLPSPSRTVCYAHTTALDLTSRLGTAGQALRLHDRGQER